MEKEDIWKELKEKLPYSTSPEDTQRREKIWNSIDVNGNGYVSLAEVDKGMRDVIRIPTLFDTKPVLMRAWTTAKTQLKAKSKYGDDYVSKAEFRYLLLYLRQYYEYWVAFERTDTNGDHKISREEFKKAVPQMERWGIKIDDPEVTFKEVDNDGHGAILFNEFCAWAIKKHLDLEDDDNAV